jgi:hypothetical protein
MKKILISLCLLFAFVAMQAQSASKVTTGFQAPAFVYAGGGVTDTLYASDTLIWSIRVKGEDVQKLLGRLTITKSTGTVTDTVYFYGSFDGTTKDVAIDSIFNSNVSTGYKYLTASRWTNFAYPYLLVWNWDKGGVRTSVKSVRKLEMILRNE